MRDFSDILPRGHHVALGMARPALAEAEGAQQNETDGAAEEDGQFPDDCPGNVLDETQQSRDGE